MQLAQQICYLIIAFSNLSLTNVSDHNMQTHLVTRDQHAFELDSNAKSFSKNSLYVTELDYTLLTEKKIDPKLGLMQVQISRKRTVSCDHCQKQMEVEEGTVIYNKQWFHDACWQSLTRGEQIAS